MKTKLSIIGLSLLATTSAFAQSSVTLYGLIDEGIGFTNNSGGHKAWQMQSGWVAGDRWGVKGTEDLGGGYKAVFTLENGFDLNSGSLGQAGRMFGRQAYVGVQTDRFGSITAGRQYDSVVDYLAPLTANGGYAGWPFSHPYDNDNTDNSFRINNAIKYASPGYGGFRFGGTYALSNQSGGFANNRSYSVGASYTGGAFSVAAAYLQANNPGRNATGALSTDDTNFTAGRQRIWGLAGTYTWESATFGVSYTHTAVDNPTGSVYLGALPAGISSLKFDNFEVNGRYQFTPALAALAMYTFTEGRFDANGGSSKPKWHQGGLMVDYLFSKRTDLYAQAVYQHASGGTGSLFDSAYIAGSAGISSNSSQVLARVGIKHTF
ncbi:porin [Paraburkholderia phenoliruptrix]|uniref:porin n=1 Tax=Paraburkholderia phenoliruptrix TaxID=252970 RepID=UPI0034CF7E7B